MKMNLGYSPRLPRCARALKLGAVGILLATATSGLLPAAQLTLQQNVTQIVGGGYYQGETDSWNDYENTLNFGAAPDLYVGEHSSGVGDAIVMKFELPAVTCQSIPSATLSLWYLDTYAWDYPETALMIEARRLNTGNSWYENTGGYGGFRQNGLSGHGVNYRYRDANDTLRWNPGLWDAGYYESTWDGYGTNWIQETTPRLRHPPRRRPSSVRPSRSVRAVTSQSARRVVSRGSPSTVSLV